MDIRCALAGGVLCATVAVAAPDAAPERTPELQAVLAKFDTVQQTLRTLSADFTETTESPLLEEELVSQGRLFLTKPDAIRWEYRSPEEMRFVIADNEYTGYFPLRNKAERRSMRRWGEQLFRLLGVGQASAELERTYDISLDDPSADAPEADVLLLQPKKRRLKKRVETVRLWIDRERGVPTRVEYRSRNGGVRTVSFSDLRVNPPLSTNLYQLQLPDGVEITQGFSALSGLGDGGD